MGVGKKYIFSTVDGVVGEVLEWCPGKGGQVFHENILIKLINEACKLTIQNFASYIEVKLYCLKDRMLVTVLSLVFR